MKHHNFSLLVVSMLSVGTTLVAAIFSIVSFSVLPVFSHLIIFVFPSILYRIANRRFHSIRYFQSVVPDGHSTFYPNAHPLHIITHHIFQFFGRSHSLHPINPFHPIHRIFDSLKSLPPPNYSGHEVHTQLPAPS